MEREQNFWEKKRGALIRDYTVMGKGKERKKTKIEEKIMAMEIQRRRREEDEVEG